MTVSVAGLRESANTSLCDNKGVSIDAKISLNVRRRVVGPACIAGVRQRFEREARAVSSLNHPPSKRLR